MCVFIETEKKVETKSKKAYSKLSRILKTKKKKLISAEERQRQLLKSFLNCFTELAVNVGKKN